MYKRQYRLGGTTVTSLSSGLTAAGQAEEGRSAQLAVKFLVRQGFLGIGYFWINVYYKNLRAMFAYRLGGTTVTSLSSGLTAAGQAEEGRSAQFAVKL